MPGELIPEMVLMMGKLAGLLFAIPVPVPVIFSVIVLSFSVSLLEPLALDPSAIDWMHRSLDSVTLTKKERIVIPEECLFDGHSRSVASRNGWDTRCSFDLQRGYFWADTNWSRSLNKFYYRLNWSQWKINSMLTLTLERTMGFWIKLKK